MAFRMMLAPNASIAFGYSFICQIFRTSIGHVYQHDATLIYNLLSQPRIISLDCVIFNAVAHTTWINRTSTNFAFSGDSNVKVSGHNTTSTSGTFITFHDEIG